MRPGVRIVNAARGELVDEAALADAIRSGHVAGAALDVFGEEPYSGELLELEQVVVTPHLAASTTEAQDRAGVMIAEQVVSALEGGLVATAVNIPVVEQADLEVLGPYIPLAAKLGRLAAALASGRPHRIVVAAHGPLADYDTRLLTVAALNGVFQGRIDQTVNYVNAPLIAAERGIEVSEERVGVVPALHEPRAGRDLRRRRGGRGLGHDRRTGAAPLPRGRARLCDRHRAGAEDRVPRLRRRSGVIGRVGTMFGDAGVNIANMAVSRTKAGGKALMAFSIDSAAPPELAERVRSSGFDEVRFIDLL